MLSSLEQRCCRSPPVKHQLCAPSMHDCTGFPSVIESLRWLHWGCSSGTALLGACMSRIHRLICFAPALMLTPTPTHLPTYPAHIRDHALTHTQTHAQRCCKARGCVVAHAQNATIAHAQNITVAHAQNVAVAHMQNVAVAHAQNVNIFNFDYLFMPIHEGLHWSLIIVCHPGNVAKPDAEGQACILHLDSMEGRPPGKAVPHGW